jgi:hypothetical protein
MKTPVVIIGMGEIGGTVGEPCSHHNAWRALEPARAHRCAVPTLEAVAQERQLLADAG